MIIAAQKRKENIAEYLLYMYQVEDLIRANGLDLDHIESTLINHFEVDYNVKREMREWYKSLIIRMTDEGKEESGHLDSLENITGQLYEMHLQLLEKGVDRSYGDIFGKAGGSLEGLRMRSGHSHENDVQVALNGLYGLLLLKVKKTPVSRATEKAFEPIREWVAELSARFMDRQNG